MAYNQLLNSGGQLNFYPAELCENRSRWYISYYVRHPDTGQMVRKMIRLGRIKNKNERRKVGRLMVSELNDKLMRGWNPFIEEKTSTTFTNLDTCQEKYVEQIERQFSDGQLRKDSRRTYLSNQKMFFNWCKRKKVGSTHAFSKRLVLDYLDWIYFKKKNSPRTHNNHLNFLKEFFQWCRDREYMESNPCEGIKKKKVIKKKREIIPPDILNKIMDHFHGDQMELFCSMMLFTFIRRKELSLLKVGNIDLKNGVICIESEISKNKKTQFVTIPKQLGHILVAYLSKRKSKQSDFLFSENGNTGRKARSEKYYTYKWDRMRKALQLPMKYQLYSLKDTGITMMLRAGVPVIAVRDQARHYDISMTNTYTQVQNDKNEDVSNFTFDF